MNKPYILGICGGSASGKTYLQDQLMAQFPAGKLTLLSQDNYYKPLDAQERDAEGLVNFDHPNSIDLDRYTTDVRALIHGKTLTIQEYTFNNPQKQSQTLTFHPAPLIILEGLFVFFQVALNELIDLKVFVDAEEHIRLARRLRRDTTERGYSVESIMRDYEKFVAPMYQRYIAPTKLHCDLIIQNNTHMQKAVDVIRDHLITAVPALRTP